MKKLVFLFLFALSMVSCSLEDDGPIINYEYAEVVDVDLPESFEKGKIYQLEVTYLLPSACHTPLGIEVRRGAATGDERRDIYVVGVTSINAEITDCDVESENLEKKKTFSLNVDEDEPFTFYLWDGLDDEGESQYVTIEVPVVDPDDDEDEE